MAQIPGHFSASGQAFPSPFAGRHGPLVTLVHCPTESPEIPQKGYSRGPFSAHKRLVFCYK